MAEEKIKNNEELARLVYLQNLYNQQYEFVLNEITSYSIAQAALKRNQELLEKKDKVKDVNVLLNAEGGTYIEASIKNINKVVTYVGAGYLVEKEVSEAKDFLSKNLETGEKGLKRLVGDKQKLENELMKIQYSIEVLQQGK